MTDDTLQTRGLIPRLLHDVQVGVHTSGPRAFVGRVLRGQVGRLYRRALLRVIEHDIASTINVPTPEGVQITAFNEDWDAVDPFVTYQLMREFRRRDSAGRECLLAWRDGRVVGYSWMSRKIDPAVEGLPLALPDDAVYLWDLFVATRERGTGVGSALTKARFAVASEAGFTRGWRAISVTNEPSIRTAEKLGAVRVLGEIRIERTFGPKRLIEERFEDRPLLAHA